MNKQQGLANLLLIILAVTVMAGIGGWYVSSRNLSNDSIKVLSLSSNQIITSPLTIAGEAPGSWYFEASFPVKLVDATGKVLGTAVAQAQSDWQTTDLVPFKAELSFVAPITGAGTLVLEKDNPSGLPANAGKLEIPVRFNQSLPAERSIKLYYYKAAKDKDATGNVLCSKSGLEAVTRQIPVTQTPIQDSVKLLLKGELTSEEKAQGISTGYPLPGLELKSASLSNGVLTLTLADPENQTSGGSCRANILWSQIEATAKQFPEVSSVRFMPEELFQP